MKFLIIFIYLITTCYSYSIETPNIKNLVINKNLKTYEEIVFKDENQKDINLDDYKGKLLILNFWATWCAPCREEMPSLDLIQSDYRLDNLKIFPINIGQEDLLKSVLRIAQLNPDKIHLNEISYKVFLIFLILFQFPVSFPLMEY